MAHLSTGSCHHVMSHVLVKVSHLSAAASQDGTSFDWFMSCHMCLSRCLTFRQHPVKMAHLSTGSCHHVMSRCTPFGSSQSRWHIFRLVHVIMSCHMCLSRCLTFRGSSQSRWHIFRLVHVMSHVLVKVSHLSAAPSQDGTSFDWFMSSCHVKVSHLSAAASQDGTSFDWFMSSCHVTCACQGVSPFAAAASQDGTSFDWFMSCHMYLSRCLAFYTVKMAHLFAVFSCVIIVCYLEAVHRFYESRRRLFNDDQPSRREKAGKVKKKCKKIVQQKKVNVHAYRITYFFYYYCCSYTIIERRF